jgi:cell division protein FtsL
MDLVIWINTIVVLAIVSITLVVVVYENRKIAEALSRVEETAARNERLSLAVLERLTPQQGPQA